MRKKLLENISINIFLKAFTYLASFVIVLYVTRVLQPAAFGRVSFASTVTGYFALLANLGMPIYATRTCAEKRDDRKELSHTVNELWSIGVLLSIISIATFFLFVWFVPRLRENRALLLIFGSGIVFQTMGCKWLFQGLEKFRFLALVTLCSFVVSLAGIVLLVHTEEDILKYAVLSVIATYGCSIFCFFMIPRYVDISIKININREHWKPLLIFFLMSCAVSVYSNLDLAMLGFMKTDFETGLYSIAAKGKSALTLVSGVVWATILPHATELWKNGERRQFEVLAQKTLVIVFGVQLLVTIVCFCFAKAFILLLGGGAYLGAVPAFRILLLSLIPIGLSNILGGQVLIPAGKEKRLLSAELAGAVFNFAANLFVIPRFSIEGAAVTTVLSEAIVWLICLYYTKKDLKMDFGTGLVSLVLERIIREWQKMTALLVNRIWGERLPFYCPCCDKHLRGFVSGGFDRHPERYDAKRYARIDQNVVCPVCYSVSRHRILVSWMQDYADQIRGKRILHFAQEKSVCMWLDRNQLSYTTADLFQPADLKIDIEDTGLQDGAYDVIICNHVLEHVHDYKKALRELYRILRPEGMIFLSFPVDETLQSVYEDESVCTEEGRRTHFGQNDHLRVFGKDSKEMLERFGFLVEEIRGEDCDDRIKPVIGPADYDYNVVWRLTKKDLEGKEHHMAPKDGGCICGPG